MSPADPTSDATEAPARQRRRLWPQRWLWRMSLIALLALVAFGIAIWAGRERIAGNLIDDTLAQNGIEARYDIVSIGPQQQVIANLVVGDPRLPDLTVERVLVDIVYSFGAPRVGRVTLVRPRLYGSFRDGAFSLGSLDPLIYAESDAPPALPALDVAIVDGRAQIASDYGTIGAKLEGAGRLDGGFEGILAATAPGLGTGDCRAQAATLYGEIAVEDGSPRFDGPVRLRGVDCAGARIDRSDIAAQVALASDFAALDGDFGIDAAQMGYGDTALAGLNGEVEALWRFAGEGQGTLSVRHDLAASGLSTPWGRVGQTGAEGTLRMRDNLARSEWTARIEGERIALDLARNPALASARKAGEGTLAGALLAKLERGLTRSLDDGRMTGDVTVRGTPEGWRAIVPEARLRSGGGETVLALSRVSYASRDARLVGNILTGGPDLPQINGRMEQTGGGELALRMTMAEYREGGDALAIPRLELRQNAGGRVTFDGLVLASGALPGGKVRGLQLPVGGSWSAREGLAMGQRCTDVKLASLTLAQLALGERRMRLCPADGRAMLRYRDALNVAVASDDLELAGTLGETPTRITANLAVLRYPGPFTLSGLEAVIGAPGSAVRLTAATLDGQIGENVGGRFADGTAAMDVVPLDLSQMGGEWSFADGVLRIDEGAFVLSERIDPANGPDPRFEPLAARGATLTLADGIIRAEAGLRHPDSSSLVTTVNVRHDLSSGRGRADLAVPGLRFTERFQPRDLSILADGVIVSADGTVTGDAQIVWTADGIDSTGTFRTDDFDFAAAFGPVRGVKGEIVFTDLLGLTTAPDQVIEIGSVYTGVEALGGRITYAMTDGTLIAIKEGVWPFMGGTLLLRPVDIVYGSSQGQNYVFELIGLDAATFIAQMEVDNIGASGTFDGTIPIYFDPDGNGFIRGGLLISRPPGGNVSYVGELTYEDMGAITNYAFQSLRSLDFRQMSVALDGSLAGEIITRFMIDGVRQGEGASRNFVTRRLAKLPIRFNVNVRSENFSQLALIARGWSDPSVFGNPIDQGLLRVEDGKLVRPGDRPAAPAPPPPAAAQAVEPARTRDESVVQPPESDDLP